MGSLHRQAMTFCETLP